MEHSRRIPCPDGAVKRLGTGMLHQNNVYISTVRERARCMDNRYGYHENISYGGGVCIGMHDIMVPSHARPNAARPELEP